MREKNQTNEKRLMRKKWVKGDLDFSIKSGHDKRDVLFKYF
jgi:hypothetical protein